MEQSEEAVWLDEIKEIEEGVARLEPYALAEHRELLEVRLPASVTELGRLAFYNCRNLRKLSFWDGLREVGDGAFKNCEKLSELVIYTSEEAREPGEQEAGKGNSGKRGAGLKGILSELDGAFTVHFMDEAGTLYFPAYKHQYEENTAARIINQITYGIGVHYRECVTDAGVDYQKYDALFERCIPVDEEAAGIVAFYRCGYPQSLHRNQEERYRSYLYEHRGRILSWLAGQEDMPLLRKWTELSIYKTDAEWKQAVEQMREAKKWEAVSLLMQERQKRYGERRKNFEL